MPQPYDLWQGPIGRQSRAWTASGAWTPRTRVEQGLRARFPLLAGAGVGLTHLGEVTSARQRYGLQVFLRDLSVCVCGEDLRPGLPRTRPSAAVAAAVAAACPEWASAARQAAEQGRRPVADPRAVAELLDTYGRWWRRRSAGFRRLRDQFESVARPLGCAAEPAA